MKKIPEEKLKFNTPVDIDKDYIDLIFCKINPDRYSGGGYHPVRAMNIMFRTNSEKIKNDVIQINKKYLIERNGYILFPYMFDFALHNNKNNVMKSGWFSGMAQGYALIAYTGVNDREMCDKILNSFESPEICKKTKNGHHYMEYPNKCDALNGHIYALYGIYKYWFDYQTEQSEFLFNEGVKWVKHNLHYYRNEGNASFYCQDHKVLCNKVDGKYHKVHIEQLRYLHEITGDNWFEEQADLFLKDFL